MRGLHATLATEMGATGELVARAMGHADQATTERSYTQKTAVRKRKQRAVMRVLEGGKKGRKG